VIEKSEDKAANNSMFESYKGKLMNPREGQYPPFPHTILSPIRGQRNVNATAAQADYLAQVKCDKARGITPREEEVRAEWNIGVLLLKNSSPILDGSRLMQIGC
jgi:hypothetical protein